MSSHTASTSVQRLTTRAEYRGLPFTPPLVDDFAAGVPA